MLQSPNRSQVVDSTKRRFHYVLANEDMYLFPSVSALSAVFSDVFMDFDNTWKSIRKELTHLHLKFKMKFNIKKL